MGTRELVVFGHLPGSGFVPAGRLTLTEDTEVRACVFAYGTRYLQRPDGFEIDPVSLGFGDGRSVRGLSLFPANSLTQFGGIRDAAPDAWGRRVIEAQRRVPANSLSEADYLLGAGSDRVGALDVRPALDSDAAPGAGSVHELSNLLEAAARVEGGQPIPARLEALFAAGPSMGGARPKVSVRDDAGLLWLAKFPAQGDTFDVAAAEYCTLKLAALCGLTVPELALLDVGGRPVLLVRRFDRYWRSGAASPAAATVLHETRPGDGRVEARLPFVSGLTMLAADASESPLKSYADLALAMRKYADPRVSAQDREQLFARMVFNIFVSNDDDHLRNHGFVRDPRLGGWRLSPLYDVVPRPGVAHDRYLHLQVGSNGKLATLDNALSAFSAFTPRRPVALAIIRKIWGELRQWQQHFESCGASGALIGRLAPAVRDLEDIASAALQAEIRRPAPDRTTGVTDLG